MNSIDDLKESATLVLFGVTVRSRTKRLLIMEGSEHTNSIHQYRTCQSNNLHVVKSKLEYYNRSFTITGTKLWNSLPQNVKDMPTLSSFKHSCKTYFLSVQQFSCHIWYVYMILCFYDFSLLTYAYIVNIILYLCVNVRCACLGLPKIVFYN